MEKVVEKLQAELENILQTEEKLFLVDIVAKGNNRSGKIIILLDGDEGISIDQCASISRRLSRYMDEHIELESPLTLEVSSAGLDHPLSMLRQYHKNIGKQVKTVLIDGKEITGTLQAADEEAITLEVVKDKKKKLTEETKVNFKEISKTIVLISFK